MVVDTLTGMNTRVLGWLVGQQNICWSECWGVSFRLGIKLLCRDDRTEVIRVPGFFMRSMIYLFIYLQNYLFLNFC